MKTLVDILIAICGLTFIYAFFMLIGTVGSVEQNLITISESIGDAVLYIIMLLISGAVLAIYANKDTKSTRR